MPRHLLLIGASLLAGTGPAFAEPAPTDLPEIVVEGTKEYDEQIKGFVKALTDAPVGGQLSRFDWAVCPAAVGLPESQNRQIADRMRQVAGVAGMNLAAPDCRPNALVIVADDQKEFIDALWRKYPVYFKDPLGRRFKPPAVKKLATAWHIESLRDYNGNVPAQDLLQDFFITDSVDASRLNPGAMPHFVAGIVLIERKALTGLTTTQVADYAAMRIFARTDPGRLNVSAPTILNVLSAPMGSSVPVTMTDWDLAFLKALYSSRERQFAGQQRNEMNRVVRKELAKPQPEEGH